jgi:16S rRNA (guanine(966)-N(2))-methyltransferase RsmD
MLLYEKYAKIGDNYEVFFVRIITGHAKGTKLKTPRGLETRPTADRVKESVFNILGDAVWDALVLDLFAGTGNLGLEALSRGARHAVFIDQSLNSVAIIKENALHTKLAEHTEVHKDEVVRALAKMIRSGRLFDLVFCDPPYNQGLVARVLQQMDENPVLVPGGIMVIEHSKHEIIAAEWKKLTVKRTERYGETLMSFLTQC